jgi:hypothetical protein
VLSTIVAGIRGYSLMTLFSPRLSIRSILSEFRIYLERFCRQLIALPSARKRSALRRQRAFRQRGAVSADRPNSPATRLPGGLIQARKFSVTASLLLVMGLLSPTTATARVIRSKSLLPSDSFERNAARYGGSLVQSNLGSTRLGSREKLTRFTG